MEFRFDDETVCNGKEREREREREWGGIEAINGRRSKENNKH